MSAPLKTIQKTTPPLKNTRKVVSTTGKTTAKTPCSRMQKIPRKKLHQGKKANCRPQIRQILTTTMMMLTGLVPRKTTTKATETALETAEVTGIPVPEEAPRNGCGS